MYLHRGTIEWYLQSLFIHQGLRTYSLIQLSSLIPKYKIALLMYFVEEIIDMLFHDHFNNY